MAICKEKYIELKRTRFRIGNRVLFYSYEAVFNFNYKIPYIRHILAQKVHLLTACLPFRKLLDQH